MEIKASDVKALRDKTGAGMMECKKALQQCNGNAEEAEKYLKEKGLAAVEKRADRATGEGIIVLRSDEKKTTLTELTCETDFVSTNGEFVALGDQIADKVFAQELSEVTEELKSMVIDLATKVRENMGVSRVACIKAGDDEAIFSYVHHDKKTASVVVLKTDKKDALAQSAVKEFGKSCAMHLAAYSPRYLKRTDIEQAFIDEQLDLFTQQAADLDKPENVKKGIIQGKLNKYLASICFLDQMFIDDEKMSVEKKMAEVAKSVGASLSVSQILIWKLGVK